jgi:hypothetical protein
MLKKFELEHSIGRGGFGRVNGAQEGVECLLQADGDRLRPKEDVQAQVGSADQDHEQERGQLCHERTEDTLRAQLQALYDLLAGLSSTSCAPFKIETTCTS